ncbi:MAG: InlB B-repeat-containing protein, partial [Eubacterium sp.]|nr:InlB B-repeat-containing protein [Eubacterium sp.]
YYTSDSDSSINLYMQNDSSYMAVKGNFTFNPGGKSGNFTAGKLAVGGTYTNNSGLNGTVLVTASDDDFDGVFIETTTAEAASETTTEGASETTTAADSGSSSSSSDGSSENTYDPYSVSLDYPSKFLGFGNKTYLPGTPSKKKKEYVEEFYEWVKEFGYDDIISEEDVSGIILDYIPSLAYYEDSIAFTSDEYTTFDVMRDIIMLNSTLKSLNQWEQEYLIDPDAVNLTEAAERVKNIISEYTDYEESVDRNPLVTAIYTVYSQQLINTVATAELKIVKSMFTDNVTNVINEGGSEELYDLMMEFNAAWKDCGIVSLSGIPEEVLDKLKSKSFKSVSKALVKSVISDIADEHSDVKLVYDIYNTSKKYISGFKATSLMAQYAPGVLFQIQLLKLGKEIYDAIEETKSAQYFMINYYFKHALPDLYDEIIDDEGNILSDVIAYNMLSGRTAFANELMNNWYSTNQSILDDETRTSLMTMANTAAQIQLADVNSMRREVVEYWANKLVEEKYNLGLCQVQYTFSSDDTFEIADTYGNVIGMYSPDTGFVAYGTSTISLLGAEEDSSADTEEETAYIVTIDEENGSVCVVVKDTTLSVIAYEQTSPSTVTAVTKGGSVYSEIYDAGGSYSVTYSIDEDGNITASDSSGETVDSTGTYSQAQSITDFDAENLKILYSAGDSADSVSANIELLTEGAYGSTITWASSSESIISTSGEVTRTAENQTVTLTATISYGDISTTKEFVLTVLSNIVTVSFDSCGGSEVSAQSLTAGDIADVSEIPEKDGYSFEGWYIDSYYNYPYEGEKIFGSITLYAKWISNGADWVVSDITLFIYSMGTETDYEAGEAEWYDSRDLFDTVYISDCISGIGENAFYGCESLKTVVIPNSVTNIAETAFDGCTGITEVYCFANSAAAEFFADSEAEIHCIGDVNSDGNADKTDAALMLKYVSGLASYDDISGYITDYNYDGVFNILDASAVMNSLKE